MTKIVSIDEQKCLGCGQCVLVCDFDALEVRYGLSRVNLEECVACGLCLEYCPVKALDWEQT